MKIHEHGHVILEDSYGDDLTIVNAARQSFNKRSDKIGNAEAGLINFLMKNRHGTPFEMVDFRFNIKCPIFVVREWHRHRIASYNEMSGRYTELQNEFFVPEKLRTQVGKPGAYTFETIEDVTKETIGKRLIKTSYDHAWNTYKKLIKSGVAKEQARIVLPVGIYTQFTFKANLRALFNFVGLRSHKDAMQEIRDYSKAMETFIEQVVPIAWDCFEGNGRNAP